MKIQDKMLPDYIMGHHQAKTDSFYYQIAKISSLTNKIELKFDRETGQQGVYVDNIDNPMLKALISNDTGMQVFLGCIDLYKKNDRKNYVFSTPLIQALKKVGKTKLNTDFLPSELYGFMRFPCGVQDGYGSLVNDAFFAIREHDGGKTMVCSWVSSDEGLGHQNYIFKDGEDIYQNEQVKSDNEFLGFILNAIIYAAKSEESVNELVNEYKGSQKAQARQRSIGTHLPFVRLGEQFKEVKFDPTYKTDEWSVAPHYRLQPCGPGRENIKLTFIQGHTRRRSEDKLEK